MFRNPFKRAATSRQIDSARVPDGVRVYAIGDVHGRNDLLQKLLIQIDTDNASRSLAETQLIFLGDLVDRGPDSSGVIETAMALRASGRNVRFLLGNHEEVFLSACRARSERALRYFMRIGGDATLLSYPITRAEFLEISHDQLIERLDTLIPREHLDFLDSFENRIIIGDYAFVHAGIRPGVSIAEQKRSDLRWIREEFTGFTGELEKVIIYGHTIYADVEEAGSRIGIDTGAFDSGKLTAIGLEGGERWYLQT